jgi:hypothetical protein
MAKVINNLKGIRLARLREKVACIEDHDGIGLLQDTAG